MREKDDVLLTRVETACRSAERGRGRGRGRNGILLFCTSMTLKMRSSKPAVAGCV